MTEKGQGEILQQPGGGGGSDHQHAAAERFRDDLPQGHGGGGSDHKVMPFMSRDTGSAAVPGISIHDENGNSITVRTDGRPTEERASLVSDPTTDRIKDMVSGDGKSIIKDWNIDPSTRHIIETLPLWQGPDLHQHEEPSKEEVQSAKDKVDGKIDGLISTADKATLKNMQDAALSGDPKAFGDAINGLKDDPARLKDFVKEMNKNFKDSDAGLNATVDEKGNVVLYGDHGKNAVEIGADGTSRVRALEREPDGTVIMKDGEVLNKDPNKVMKHISDNAVSNIERPPYLTLDNSDGWWNKKPILDKLKDLVDEPPKHMDPKWMLL